MLFIRFLGKAYVINKTMDIAFADVFITQARCNKPFYSRSLYQSSLACFTTLLQLYCNRKNSILQATILYRALITACRSHPSLILANKTGAYPSRTPL